MTYAVKFMVDGIVPQQKEFFTFQEARDFFERIGNRARYLLSVDYEGNETIIARKKISKPFDYSHIKNIMDIPCARKVNGEKCISVNQGWAYVQYCDGMEVYRYNNAKKEWDLYEREICTNF